MDSSEILRIVNPEELFGPDIKSAHAAYQRLMREWHPDHCKIDGAGQVSSHINNLYHQFKTSGNEDIPPKKVSIKEGKHGTYTYYIEHRHDGYETMYGPNINVQVFDAKHYVNLKNGLGLIRKARQDMPVQAFNELSRYIPQNDTIELDSHQNQHVVFFVQHTEEPMFMLHDVLQCMPSNVLPLEHVAWIMSALFGILCGFEMAGITHNAITLNSCYINPDKHTVHLLGGWCCAVKVGNKYTVLPRSVLTLLNDGAFGADESSSVIDNLLVRQIGLALLGQGTSKIPAHVIGFLRDTNVPNALSSMREWEHHMEKVFGKRRFVHMPVSAYDVFGRSLNKKRKGT